MGLPPNYGIPTSHASMDQPELLRSNHPTYSLPVPGASRQTDHMGNFQYEAPTAVSQAAQMGRPIGNIGQVRGPSIGKVGSSSSIGSIGQMAPPPSIGRVSVGHVGPQASRGIGPMGAGIGQVGPSGIGHAGSGIGQVPSIGHAGSGIGQVGPKLGHAGSGIGQIGSAAGNEVALARPNVGHLPHSLSAKQQSLLNYAGGSGQYGHMGHMMGWPMGGQAHGMIGTLGGPPQASNMYGQAPGNIGGMYGYGPGGMMGGTQMQGVGLPHRPSSIHAPGPYADPSAAPALPNHVSIHSVPESSTSADPGLDKLTSAASLAHQTSNARGPKVPLCSDGANACLSALPVYISPQTSHALSSDCFQNVPVSVCFACTEDAESINQDLEKHDLVVRVYHMLATQTHSRVWVAHGRVHCRSLQAFAISRVMKPCYTCPSPLWSFELLQYFMQ